MSAKWWPSIGLRSELSAAQIGSTFGDWDFFGFGKQGLVGQTGHRGTGEDTSESNGRVEVTARDMTEGVGHHDNGEAEGESDPEESDAP